MHVKSFFILFCFQVSMALSGWTFAQNIEQNSKLSTSKDIKPKAVMPAKANEIEKRVKNKDSANLNKAGQKWKNESVETKEDLLAFSEVESLIQGIITKNSEDFANYERLTFEDEHITYFLEDTISFDILRNQNQLNKTTKSLEVVLTNFGKLFSDSTKRNKALTSALLDLRNLIKEENTYKDSLTYLQNFQKQKEKDLAEAKKLLEKVQIRIRPNFDSINRVILNLNETTLLNITFNKVRYRILVVPTPTSIIKIHNNGRKSLQSLKHVWDTFKEKPYALLNAGMYKDDGSAQGLMIANKKQINKLDEAKTTSKGNFYMQPNGVFYIDTLGKVFVVKTDDYKKSITPLQYKVVDFATQSGPMLMINGKSNPNFAINSPNRNIRNGIGVVDNSDNKIAIFIISDSPCTFYEMASLYRLLKCSNALYLDGAISKMYTEIKGKRSGNISDGGLGPIISVSKKK